MHIPEILISHAMQPAPIRPNTMPCPRNASTSYHSSSCRPSNTAAITCLPRRIMSCSPDVVLIPVAFRYSDLAGGLSGSPRRTGTAGSPRCVGGTVRCILKARPSNTTSRVRIGVSTRSGKLQSPRCTCTRLVSVEVREVPCQSSWNTPDWRTRKSCAVPLRMAERKTRCTSLPVLEERSTMALCTKCWEPSRASTSLVEHPLVRE
jgi:hypothetical protein